MSLPQKQTRPRVADEECVHRPVLALSALELAVERAVTGPTSCRCGCGADLTVQCQVDGGAAPHSPADTHPESAAGDSD